MKFSEVTELFRNREVRIVRTEQLMYMFLHPLC